MNILVPNHKYFAFILVSLLITVTISISDAVDDATVPNVMLRVVRVTPDWMPFASTDGWTQAVPLKESEVLKYYEVAIWEETSSVHLYELPNDYDAHYGEWWNEEEQESVERTDAEKIAYRRFSPNFIAFFDGVRVDYPFNTDLYQYMIDNQASQTLIEQFNDVIVHKADNKDFFQWNESRNGILMPDPDYLRQRLTSLNTPEDVNGDGTVNIQDLVLVASSLGETGENAADVNADEIVDIRDLVLVAGAFGTEATAPFLHTQVLAQFSTADVRKWLSEAQHLNLTDPTAQRGIRFLEQLLATLIPKTTSLLPNYPNPFNPETWIPYKLAKPADVTLTIYAVNGQIVRQMSLGHQFAGIYQSKSRAVYWDGKNAIGEPVASGLYFYTLTAGDFTATRKMLIRK